jgi:hypothetical protein
MFDISCVVQVPISSSFLLFPTYVCVCVFSKVFTFPTRFRFLMCVILVHIFGSCVFNVPQFYSLQINFFGAIVIFPYFVRNMHTSRRKIKDTRFYVVQQKLTSTERTRTQLTL